MTPYQKVAKEALMNWNGLSEEEAMKKIQTESVDELESQVYAMDSVGAAVAGVKHVLNLTDEEYDKFLNAVLNGPEDAEIFKTISSKANELDDSKKLDVLAVIHNVWVINNSFNPKTFEKKKERKQLRQFAPLELIGFNEVKSDLLFLKPVLESIGVPLDEKTLEEVYHKRVDEYLDKMNITSKADLEALISMENGYYGKLMGEFVFELEAVKEEVANQIIENWKEKDVETFKIFECKANSISHFDKLEENNKLSNDPNAEPDLKPSTPQLDVEHLTEEQKALLSQLNEEETAQVNLDNASHGRRR